MFLRSFEITPKTLVAAIVAGDYRTADIFNKYGIEYCCGGKQSLEAACMSRGVEVELLMDEIKTITRSLQLPGNLPFHQWKIDFLIDHIIHIHHYYLHQSLPALGKSLKDFASSHNKQYPGFQEIVLHFNELEKNIIPHMRYEEDTIFPYLRQVAHAYEEQGHYARLLVKTLRKPIGLIMDDDHRIVHDIIHKFRQLTDHYTPPERCCTNHLVILSKLKELDNNLTQHVYLENDVLFPGVIAMEKELLAGG